GLRSGDPLGIPPGPPDGRGRVGWLKLFGDGTLGSRTALLLDPYEPEPDRGEPPGGPLGVAVTSAEELADLAERAAVGGIATQIHAIGDRALRGALVALSPTAGRTALRPRIEHVQLADQADMPRFAAHGIFASVQPHHLSGDAPRVRPTWGDRARNSYPWRRLVDYGATLAFGTDAPTDSVDPWPGLAMAITRRDPAWSDDVGAFFPNESLTIGQALRASCVGPALTAGELDRGRLVAGHRADLVVVPAKVLADADVLRSARPRLVLMDGVPVHEA